MIACSVFVEGEYEQKMIFVLVSCIIGKNGVEEIERVVIKKSNVC
jgi:malate dehydrogenase